MSDYKELVEQLKDYSCCRKGEIAELTAAAAAAIEELEAEVKRLEPKRGEWSEENRRPRSSQFVCSVCHRTAYDPQPTRGKAWRKRCRYSYCPNCGANMTEAQE